MNFDFLYISIIFDTASKKILQCIFLEAIRSRTEHEKCFMLNFVVFHQGQGLDDGIDCPIEEEEIVEEEEEYDALNDETFGSEATAGDWERDHEKLAHITETGRHHHTGSSKVSFP